MYYSAIDILNRLNVSAAQKLRDGHVFFLTTHRYQLKAYFFRDKYSFVIRLT